MYEMIDDDTVELVSNIQLRNNLNSIVNQLILECSNICVKNSYDVKKAKNYGRIQV